MNNEILRQQLQELKRKGFRLSVIARAVGVVPSHITMFVNGQRGLSEAVSQKVAEAIEEITGESIGGNK